MNFLGLHKKLQPIHIHWIYYLADPEGYTKARGLLSFSSIALYSREETLKKARNYLGYEPVKELTKIIEDADRSR